MLPSTPHPFRLLIGSHGTRAEGGVAVGAAGARSRADSGSRPHGRPCAGPVATAEAGGAPASGGSETAVQAIRSQCARARVPPGGHRRPGVWQHRGPCPQARGWPGETQCSDPAEWFQERRPALPEVYCRGVWAFQSFRESLEDEAGKGSLQLGSDSSPRQQVLGSGGWALLGHPPV